MIKTLYILLIVILSHCVLQTENKKESSADLIQELLSSETTTDNLESSAAQLQDSTALTVSMNLANLLIELSGRERVDSITLMVSYAETTPIRFVSGEPEVATIQLYQQRVSVPSSVRVALEALVYIDDVIVAVATKSNILTVVGMQMETVNLGIVYGELNKIVEITPSGLSSSRKSFEPVSMTSGSGDPVVQSSSSTTPIEYSSTVPVSSAVSSGVQESSAERLMSSAVVDLPLADYIDLLDDRVVFDDFADGNFQNRFAMSMAAAGKVDAKNAGGYWAPMVVGSGLVIDQWGNGVTESGAAAMIVDTSLHVTIETGPTNENLEIANYAGVTVPLIEYGRAVDLSLVRVISVTARGSGIFTMEFETDNLPDWGVFMARMDLTESYKVFTYKTYEFKGSMWSLIEGESLDDYLDKVTRLAFALYGDNKRGEIEISNITFGGIDIAEVP